jgi:hypothetical protein
MCHPETMTPWAPWANALSKKPELIRPVHITLTKRTLTGYWIREIPARSAAAYAHQWQTNAIISGLWVSDINSPNIDYL